VLRRFLTKEGSMAWEYKLVHLVSDTVDDDEYEVRLHESVHLLNSLGKEGWELIGFLPHRSPGHSRRYHMILKRPVT
jgi:hypothetical protein